MRWLPAFFCALLLVLSDDTILLKSLHITPGSLVLYLVLLYLQTPWRYINAVSLLIVVLISASENLECTGLYAFTRRTRQFGQ